MVHICNWNHHYRQFIDPIPIVTWKQKMREGTKKVFKCFSFIVYYYGSISCNVYRISIDDYCIIVFEHLKEEKYTCEIFLRLWIINLNKIQSKQYIKNSLVKNCKKKRENWKFNLVFENEEIYNSFYVCITIG